MSDTVTPRWERRKAAGEIIFNEMTSSKKNYELLGSSSVTLTHTIEDCLPATGWHNTYNSSRNLFAYLILGGPGAGNSVLISGKSVDSLITETWTSCMASRQNTGQNLIETLAEYEQAYQMFGKPFSATLKFVNDFRRQYKGKRLYKYAKRTRSGAQALSGEYLQYRYGLSPLISDCQAVLKTLKTRYSNKPQLQTSRASKNMHEGKWTPGTFVNGYTVDYIKAQQHDITCRATWIDLFTSTPWTDLGLTFHNLVGVAWELTHFSFVLDWFVNVGDLFYANIPRVNVTPKGGCISVKDEFQTVFTPVHVSYADPLYVLSGGLNDSVSFTDTSYYRRLGTESYLGLVIKSDFRLDHFTRACDAAALIVQQLNQIHFH
jgi:hypothetical protein